MIDPFLVEENLKALIRTRACRAHGWGHLVRMKFVAEFLLKNKFCDEIKIIAETDDQADLFIKDQFPNYVRLNPDCPEEEEFKLVSDLQIKGNLTIFDMLEATPGRQKFYQERSQKTLLIDELRCHEHTTDYVVCAQLIDRPIPASKAQVLEGLNYFIIHPRFSDLRNQGHRRFPISKVLVMLGGGAYPEAFIQVANLLSKTSWITKKLIFVIGHDNSTQLGPKIKEIIPQSVILSGVPNDKVAELMSEVDFAFMSAGYSKYEAACLGLPQAMIAVQDHQDSIGEAFAKTGAALYLGPWEKILEKDLEQCFERFSHEKTFLEMSKAATEAIDGRGIERVFQHVFQGLKSV